MKNLVHIFKLIFLFILPLCGSGQNPPSLLFKHLDYRNGLSDPNIQALYTDNLGFLWIGTHNGLNRFDGYNSVEFSGNAIDTLNLKGNILTSIIQDTNGDLFMGTQMGLSRYNYNTGAFDYFKFRNRKYYYAYPFFKDSDGKIWCNAAGEIYVTDTTFHFLTDKTNGKSYVNKNQKGKLTWFMSNASKAGLFVHYVKDYAITHSIPYFREDFKLAVSDIYIASESSAWVGTDRGLVHLNPHTGKYELFQTGTGVNCIFPYKHWLFIGTNGEGLKIFDTRSQRFIATYSHQRNSSTSIAGDKISRIHVDQKDNLYVAVQGNGLSYTNLKQAVFDHFLDKSVAINSGIDNVITSIIQAPDGDIWCSTHADGILIYDKNFRKLKEHILRGEGINSLFVLGKDKLLAELKEKKSLIGSFQDKQFVPLSLSAFPSGISYAVTDPVKGSGILCSPNGAARLGADGVVEFLNGINHNIEWSNISHVSFVSQNTMLLQTYYTNLYLAERQGDDFRIVREIGRTPFNINSSVKVNGTMYLATTSGLFQYKINEQKLSGKPVLSAFCTAVVSDGKEKLWVNTHSGLYNFEVNSGKSSHFTEADGLQGAVFNPGTLIRLKNGKIITGGNNGVNYFHSDSLSVSDPAVEAYITKVNINDHHYYESNPVNMKSLHLDHHSNTISFQVTPVDFKNAHFRRMSYQMVGYDSDPIETQGVSEIRYAKMPPGSYIFKVLVEGNPVPTILSIEISPPFWQKKWFLLIAVLSAVGGTMLVTYLFAQWVRNNQLEKLRIMLNSQEEERKRIAVDLHDDLGGRLSSLKLYMQATARGISEEHKGTFRDTTRLLDEAISELRNILFNLSPKTLDENGLEAAIIDLAANIERITGLKIETNIDTQKIKIGRPVQYAVYRICQELINNTLKHSEATEVFVSLVYREDGLVFLYEDNGKGFSRDNVKPGYGLTNIETHAQAIFSDLTIDSMTGKGTAVTLTIPKDAIHFEPGTHFKLKP